MTTVAGLHAALQQALLDADLRVKPQGAELQPPAVSIGAPTLTWATGPAEPDSVTFPLTIVVASDDRAMTRLWELIPTVAEAVETVPNAVVVRAVPSFFTAGGTELPAYALTVDCAVG